MKRVLVPIIAIFATLGLSLQSCDEIEQFLSQTEAIEGLKEALFVGSDTAVAQGSAVNGYFNDTLIKILLPPEANIIVDVINDVPGIGPALIDTVVLRLNRAAEDAAPQAANILIHAITNITFTDALAIINGSNDAATQYLRAATKDTINFLFRPHIDSALTQVGAQSAWETLTQTYNPLAPFLPGGPYPQVNTDLARYTTERASFGLFKLIAIEEEKIREDPLHRVNEILQSVFGD
jgi:hypothetical protein